MMKLIIKYFFKIFNLLLIFSNILICNSQDSHCIIKETNTPGECRPVRECLSIYEILENRFQNYTQCFGSKQLVVCCPILNKPIKNSRVSYQEKCHEYQNYVYTKINITPPIPGGRRKEIKIDNCGFKNIDLISGGRDAKPRQFPHMAALGWEKKGNLKFLCGGSLISENFILTAAHCMRYSNPHIVRLGDLNINSDSDDAKPINVRVEKVFIHPKYDKNEKFNDIALVKLEENIIFDSYKRPACLSSVHDWNGTQAITTGWGHIDDYDIYGADHLQEVTIEKFTKNECQDKYNNIRNKLNQTVTISYTSQICLGSRTDKKDSCKGDSGGPLQILHSNEYCMWELVGVTSFGPSGCGHATIPGVYTRVFPYIEWIENIVWNSEIKLN